MIHATANAQPHPFPRSRVQRGEHHLLDAGGFAISHHSALQERGEEEVRGVCCWRETIARSTSIEVGVHCASAAPAAEQPLEVDAGLTRVRALPPAEEPHGLGGACRAIKAVALLYQELR